MVHHPIKKEVEVNRTQYPSHKTFHDVCHRLKATFPATTKILQIAYSNQYTAPQSIDFSVMGMAACEAYQFQ